MFLDYEENDNRFCKFDDIIMGYMTCVYMWITMWKWGISIAKKEKCVIFGKIYTRRYELQDELQKTL